MKITWRPKKSPTMTLHDQISNFFIKKITTGQWPIGTKLPSERTLSKLLSVNRTTVSTAYDILRSKGIIASQGAKGTYVINNTWSLLAASQQANWTSYLNLGMHMPNLKTIQQINEEEFKEPVIRLSTGELSSEIFPKKIFQDIMQSIANDTSGLNYEEPLGSLELREALVEYLKTIDIHVSPLQILITSGSLQALSLISLGLLQQGSTLFVEQPSYIKSLNVFPSLNMKYKGLKMTKDGLDLNGLKSTLKNGGTNMLYTIPTLHNPTGSVMNISKRRGLLDISAEHQLPIIEDDVYREVAFESMPPPIKSFDKHGNVLYLGSLSKSFSPGLRIGWIVGPQTIIEHLSDIKMQTDYGSSSLSQRVAYHWFKDGYYKKYRSELVVWLKDRRDYTMFLLDKYLSAHATYCKPVGGFYIWLTLKKPTDMNKLFQTCLKDRILINPGNIYDFEDNHAIRISYAYATKEDLHIGIKKLSEHVLAE